jgi:nicotinate phosphoribosyltransferase
MSSSRALPRLTPDLFRLPVEKIRAGYKTDTYFNRTRVILSRTGKPHQVLVQLFQKEPDATVCGVDQVLAILHAGTGRYRNQARADELFAEYLALERLLYRLWLNLATVAYEDFEPLNRRMFEVAAELAGLWESTFPALKIAALPDGEQVGAYEPVLEIQGDLGDFVHLETLMVGALTDGTMIATNTSRVVEAAGSKPVLMFGARHQAHESQAGSGYAAWIGGAQDVSTDEQGEWWGSRGIGTIPHALIAALDGDTVRATKAFAETFPDLPTVSLVDFDNTSVDTALAVARALGHRLWGVRLDTAADVTDAAIFERIQKRVEAARGTTTGVTPRLCNLVRQALDAEGFDAVRILVSGGMSPHRIREFESEGAPVDGYGVGSALYDRADGRYEFTQDVVKPKAKCGRTYRASSRLVTVDVARIQEAVAGPDHEEVD